MSSAYFEDAAGLHSPLLSGLPWLEHAFGTRHTALPENLTTVHQTHSTCVLESRGQQGNLGEGDAIIGNSPGELLGVKTADCLPILMADTHHQAVAAVHAGWRGAAGQIAVRTLEQMRGRFGTAAADVFAAIGPAIGPCCFEVGPEVAAQFGREGRVRLDLAAIVRSQLEQAGVPPGQISLSSLCTRCDARRFHSFRRDKEAAGRMMAVIGVRPK